MDKVRHVCFRPPDAAGSTYDHVPRVLPLRLGDRAAEALAELLQVFACGEESAALAFSHLAETRAEKVTRDALRHIAAEESGHEVMLRGLREALPAPREDFGLRRALVRFYGGLAHDDAGRHLACIAALDSGVCRIVSALVGGGGPASVEPTIGGVFHRIHREEAGHVRLARGLTLGLATADAAEAVAERTRHDLVGVLALRAECFDALEVDADALFRSLRHVPPGLFR